MYINSERNSNKDYSMVHILGEILINNLHIESKLIFNDVRMIDKVNQSLSLLLSDLNSFVNLPKEYKYFSKYCNISKRLFHFSNEKDNETIYSEQDKIFKLIKLSYKYTIKVHQYIYNVITNSNFDSDDDTISVLLSTFFK